MKKNNLGLKPKKTIKTINRVVDLQYKKIIKFILKHGEKVKTPQDVDALTCFGTAPSLIYDFKNGVPIITERQLFIRGAIGEMCAFINGVQDFTIMKNEYSVPEPFWGPWTTMEKTKKVGAKKGCLGDGSYGPALAAFPIHKGKTYDQIANVIRMLSDEKLQHRRTIYVTSWIPYMNGWGQNQKTVVSPCHGNFHFRVISGYLDLISWHRSADILLGFPNDMISYIALFKMVESLTKLKARRLIFQFGDAHIYENQLSQAKAILKVETRIFPDLRIHNLKKNIRDYRANDFELIDYRPNNKIFIPSAI